MQAKHRSKTGVKRKKAPNSKAVLNCGTTNNSTPHSKNSFKRKPKVYRSSNTTSPKAIALAIFSLFIALTFIGFCTMTLRYNIK